MSKYKFIIDVFNEGGYKKMEEEFADFRLKPCSCYEMTKKEKLIWKRFLHYRYKKRHPEKIKAENSYYQKKYQKEKPFVATCKKCGGKFNAPRPYYEICPECKKLPTKTQLLKDAIRERKQKKERLKEEAILWYRAGMTQQMIGMGLGVSQKTISNWVKKVAK